MTSKAGNHKFIFRLGHQAFSEKNYIEAIKQISIAIEMTSGKPKQLYF